MNSAPRMALAARGVAAPVPLPSVLVLFYGVVESI